MIKAAIFDLDGTLLNRDESIKIFIARQYERLKVLELLNVAPSESIYVGDHPENDVKASQNVGMKGIWKKDFQWHTVDADSIIDDLAELPLMIANLSKQLN